MNDADRRHRDVAELPDGDLCWRCGLDGGMCPLAVDCRNDVEPVTVEEVNVRHSRAW